MGWSDKYKKSIDCSNPKGFSQRAHCQGKKKNEAVDPDRYHRQLDADSDFYKDQKKRHEKNKKEGKPTSYRIKEEKKGPCPKTGEKECKCKEKKESFILLDFAALLEEWKPLPVDKMNRQIARKEARPDNQALDKMNAHKMRRVKAANADIEKTKQRHMGSDGKKRDAEQERLYDKANSDWSKEESQREKAEKAKNKGKDKKAAKLEKKADKNLKKGKQAYMKAEGERAERMAFQRKSFEDDKKQDAHNKEVKAGRDAAKRMMDRANLEAARKKPAVKGATKGGFKNKKEHMNFTDYVNSAVNPLYMAEDDIPKCPPGYRYDKTMKMCVPKSNRDAIGKDQKFGNKDLKPGSGPGYNTWGASGYSGDGYAFEEPPTDHGETTSGSTY